MDFLKVLIKFLNELFVPLLAYKAGKDSGENKQLKDDNEKLKEYENINVGEHSSDDAYNARLYE